MDKRRRHATIALKTIRVHWFDHTMRANFRMAQDNRPITKNRVWQQRVRNRYSFFVRADFVGRVKARPEDRNLAGNGQRRAFTPAVILFIALPETKDNI